MDVLSDAIAVMRTGKVHSALVRRPAPFGRWFPTADGAGFHVVLQGSCWLIPAQGDPIALTAGDVVLLPRGDAHGLADSPITPLVDSLDAVSNELEPDTRDDGANPTTVMLCGAYLLDRTRPHPLFGDLPSVVHLPARVGRHSELRAAVDLLGSELDHARPGRDAMLPALLDVLLLYVLRAWFATRSTDTATGWSAALRDPGLAAALHAIHTDPGRQWTVAELATRAGLSRAAFARRFTALVGQPPLTYLTWWRMTLAARLLRDGDAPVAAIARKVGYTSEFAFAAAFKRELGLAPGAFRRAGTRRTAGDQSAVTLVSDR